MCERERKEIRVKMAACMSSVTNLLINCFQTLYKKHISTLGRVEELCVVVEKIVSMSFFWNTLQKQIQSCRVFQFPLKPDDVSDHLFKKSNRRPPQSYHVCLHNTKMATYELVGQKHHMCY
jgi:hypothetical protein